MSSDLKALIAPSVLAADWNKMGDECERMLNEGADWLHMDVMDGHFVPAISFGTQMIDAVHKRAPQAYLDCHMMVSEPLKWVEEIAKAGGSSYTFHLETCKSSQEAVDVAKAIKSHGMKASIAISPQTPAENITDELGQAVDMVLVMTVHPGKGGQKFIEECMSKVTALRKRFPGTNIEVDGGVGPKTAGSCACAGANVFVSGSACFGHPQPGVAMEEMRATIKEQQPKWASL